MSSNAPLPGAGARFLAFACSRTHPVPLVLEGLLTLAVAAGAWALQRVSPHRLPFFERDGTLSSPL
jgi:membrane-associated phospholipid phosphatase